MSDELCVRCGSKAPGTARIEGDRLCHPHVGDRPTCYEAAIAALAGGPVDVWERLKAHWADVQVETSLEVERLRREHPEIYSFGPPSPHMLTTMQKRLEEK
jgi:hypothetical protein